MKFGQESLISERSKVCESCDCKYQDSRSVKNNKRHKPIPAQHHSKYIFGAGEDSTNSDIELKNKNSALTPLQKSRPKQQTRKIRSKSSNSRSRSRSTRSKSIKNFVDHKQILQQSRRELELEKRMNQMQAQILQLKSKEFESQFKIENFQKKLNKASDSYKAVLVELHSFKQQAKGDFMANRDLQDQLSQIESKMTSFKQTIFQQKSQFSAEIEKKRQEQKAQELFFNQKLDKLRMMVLQLKTDVKDKSMQNIPNLCEEIVNFIQTFQDFDHWQNDSTSTRERSKSRSRSRSRSRKRKISQNSCTQIGNNQQNLHSNSEFNKISKHQYQSTDTYSQDQSTITVEQRSGLHAATVSQYRSSSTNENYDTKSHTPTQNQSICSMQSVVQPVPVAQQLQQNQLLKEYWIERDFLMQERESLINHINMLQAQLNSNKSQVKNQNQAQTVNIRLANEQIFKKNNHNGLHQSLLDQIQAISEDSSNEEESSQQHKSNLHDIMSSHEFEQRSMDNEPKQIKSQSTNKLLHNQAHNKKTAFSPTLGPTNPSSSSSKLTSNQLTSSRQPNPISPDSTLSMQHVQKPHLKMSPSHSHDMFMMGLNSQSTNKEERSNPLSQRVTEFKPPVSDQLSERDIQNFVPYDDNQYHQKKQDHNNSSLTKGKSMTDTLQTILVQNQKVVVDESNFGGNSQISKSNHSEFESDQSTPLAQRAYLLHSSADLRSEIPGLTTQILKSSFERVSVSEHSLNSRSAGDQTEMMKSRSFTQSSQVLSEKTLNLKFKITQLDDEIDQLQHNLKQALSKRLN